MIEVKGKHNEAKVYTEVLEKEAFSQILDMCNLDIFEDCRIRIMPDVHAGKGCTIGTTLEIKDKVVPNMVGVDIGCGMYTVKIKEKRLELPKLDSAINKLIPSGTEIRDKEHKLLAQARLGELRCIKEVNLNRAKLSLGSLGGGNHFIEAAKDSQGNIYIIIHSGSRQLGLQVANYYQNKAYENLTKGSYDIECKNLIEEYTKSGKQKDIEKGLIELKKSFNIGIPKHMAYCEGDLLKDYIHDMKIVQEYAELNRKAMMVDIIKAMKLTVEDEFSTIHNYIDVENMILRKGAVSAKENEKLLIPMNMKDGSLLCRGKGNIEWNFSAPHGAGRLYSRSKAKENFTTKEYKNVMKEAGVYTTSVGKGTLDECPMAYKPVEEITKYIGDTVNIIDRLIPIYNYKSGE